jgi:hypothetical protein
VFCISVSFFFLRFSISWVPSSSILSILFFNSLISLFTVFSVSLWCLFRALMSSFICFCVCSYSLFLVYWNFLSASYMFWLTMSSNIAMKFSVITCRISSLRVFLWASLGSLASFFFVLLGSGIGYLFSSFPSESCIKLFFGGEWFSFLFVFPSLHLVLCNYVLNRVIGGFSHLFSFPWFNFVLWVYCVFSLVCVCYIFPWSGCNLVLTNSQ